MEEESKEYLDKIEVVDEKSITLLIQKVTLRMKLRLKSRLKTIKLIQAGAELCQAQVKLELDKLASQIFIFHFN